MAEELTQEELENEEAMAREFELARNINEKKSEASRIREEGRSFGSPSIIKTFVLIFLLAVPNDLIDAIELTGFASILAWVVSFILSMASIIVSWLFNHEQQRADEYMKKLEEYRRRIAQRARTTYRVLKFFRKNPTVKILIGAVAEIIPFISILPWSTVAAVWAYLDERKTYKSAREGGETVSADIADNSVNLESNVTRFPGAKRRAGFRQGGQELDEYEKAA